MTGKTKRANSLHARQLSKDKTRNRRNSAPGNIGNNEKHGRDAMRSDSNRNAEVVFGAQPLPANQGNKKVFSGRRSSLPDRRINNDGIRARAQSLPGDVEGVREGGISHRHRVQFLNEKNAEIKALNLTKENKDLLRDIAQEAGGENSLILAHKEFNEALDSFVRESAGTQTVELTGQKEVLVATGAKKKGRFGRKKVEFETEVRTLPVYRELDPDKLYFSASPAKHLESVLKNGLRTDYGGSGTGSVDAAENVGQYNSRGHVYMFNSETNAKKYGQNNINVDAKDLNKDGTPVLDENGLPLPKFVVYSFTLPSSLEFTPDPEGFNKSQEGKPLSKTAALRTAANIDARFIKSAKRPGKHQRLEEIAIKVDADKDVDEQ